MAAGRLRLRTCLQTHCLRRSYRQTILFFSPFRCNNNSTKNLSPNLNDQSGPKMSSDAKLLLRARRMATRIRAASACKPCKAKKSKCSDYRPCAQCKGSKLSVCDVEEIPAVDTPNRIWNKSGATYEFYFILSLYSFHVFLCANKEKTTQSWIEWLCLHRFRKESLFEQSHQR